ncbi:hypothetical protein GMST_09660 [Geomonas silvestris]|uniref:Uncharacterized protein n=1 Tax=Geomonas silvestris TaxID=2740184 RepID=A0A6V8MF64_9BACT|nr:hypothetical protein [Geomonas silvestris]GFO58641.1 hypothetical protein GMST_09660 [Geomonas silvestris]
MQTGRPRHSHSQHSVAAQWQELHWHYPRSATLLTAAIVLALFADLLIIFQQYRLTREEARLNTAVTRSEEQRGALEQQTAADLAQARALLPRRDALVAKELHLSVDRRQGVMYLLRDRAILREMPVYLGPELAARPEDPAPPLKTRRVQGLVDPAGTVPTAPLSGGAARPEPPGGEPLAFQLSGGLLLYSLPDTVLPGEGPPRGVRLQTDDLAALKEALRPGLRVYFY